MARWGSIDLNAEPAKRLHENREADQRWVARTMADEARQVARVDLDGTQLDTIEELSAKRNRLEQEAATVRAEEETDHAALEAEITALTAIAVDAITDGKSPNWEAEVKARKAYETRATSRVHRLRSIEGSASGIRALERSRLAEAIGVFWDQVGIDAATLVGRMATALREYEAAFNEYAALYKRAVAEVPRVRRALPGVELGPEYLYSGGEAIHGSDPIRNCTVQIGNKPVVRTRQDTADTARIRLFLEGRVGLPDLHTTGWYHLISDKTIAEWRRLARNGGHHV